MKFTTLEFNKSILNWDDALPTGDGKLGSIIYGKGPIRISVDRIDLWDNRINEMTLDEGFNYANLIRVAQNPTEENWKEHSRIFNYLSHLTPYPSKITSGRLELDFGAESDDIHSVLDMYDAVAYLTAPFGARLTVFNSAVRHVGVARITGDYKLNRHIPDYISGDENGMCAINTGLDEEAENWCMQYPRASVVSEDGFTYYHQKTHLDYNYTLMAYERKMPDGVSELYYTVATSDDAEDVLAYAKAELLGIAELGYEKLLREHKLWWHKYHGKSDLRIPDAKLQRLYDIHNYHLASCSRKGFYPMALQGVWTADNDSLPPWKGDYHFDTNVQLSYQSYMKANRVSEGEAYIDYLWNMRGRYAKFAKEFFGVDGYLLPSTSTIDGQIIGGWAMYSYAPIMTVWAIQALDEYYLYTGDKKFLRSRAYPIFRDTGKAIYSLLEKKGGKLRLPLSSSPEIFDDSKEAYLPANSNFDQALLIYLFTRLRDFSLELGYNAERYEKILTKLEPLALMEDGTLMLDRTQPLPESHRHFSHVMAIYPLHLINYASDEDKRIVDASIAQLEKYGDYKWCGFSYGMMAQIYAMAKRGDDVIKPLEIYEDCYVGENGFQLNGDFKDKHNSFFKIRAFTLEAEFCFNDAIQEMMMQEHEGWLELLPAIPKKWRSVSFKKLRSYGGLLVSLKLRKGKISYLEFNAKRDTTLKIKDNYGLSALLGKESVDGFITLDIKKGKTRFN